jgi:hypothetical protein
MRTTRIQLFRIATLTLLTALFAVNCATAKSGPLLPPDPWESTIGKSGPLLPPDPWESTIA